MEMSAFSNVSISLFGCACVGVMECDGWEEFVPFVGDEQLNVSPTVSLPDERSAAAARRSRWRPDATILRGSWCDEMLFVCGRLLLMVFGKLFPLTWSVLSCTLILRVRRRRRDVT